MSVATLSRSKRTARVYASASHIVLTGGGYEYAIERDRLATPTAVLLWVRHLSRKAWFTDTDLRAFIDICGQAIGIDLEYLI